MSGWSVTTLIAEDLEEVHITWLEGVGASYRMKGFFTIKSQNKSNLKINFSGVAFGGNYGGHNINVQISGAARKNILKAKNCSLEDIENLIAEVQRKMLNNEMIVEYDKIKPESSRDALGNP